MQHPLLEQAPELYDDIEFPDYCFTNPSDGPESIQELSECMDRPCRDCFDSAHGKKLILSTQKGRELHLSEWICLNDSVFNEKPLYLDLAIQLS